ncbi:hypothetical protein Patl1_26100 [Pistacia atlantica]|uniref:Uncharacterized protein n=1 Tax=Pistacia atlantica TaxID=434234 RepID=A0ACC1B3A3_9ROSI|nr:hypothetical protein Patl1_26100 [Pistacia atlantica]
MRSLIGCFDYVVAIIEEGMDLSTMTMEGLMGSLCSHEHRMNQRTATSVEQAFQSKVILSETCRFSDGKVSGQGKAKGFKGDKSIANDQQNSGKGRYDMWTLLITV